MNGVENEPGKDPVTRTESLVLTRLPPRAVVGRVSIQWSSEVKPYQLYEDNTLEFAHGVTERRAQQVK